MLLLGQQRQRTCGGLTRRAFLQVGGSTVLGLSLADVLRLRARGATGGSAKSVLLLWLWGGPAHLDTWDPKPTPPSNTAARSPPSPPRCPASASPSCSRRSRSRPPTSASFARCTPP